MIDWVSIVRSSGQRFSTVLTSSVPNKVRRKRRKRRIQEQQEQMIQRSQQLQQLVQERGGGSASCSSSFSGPQCTCESLSISPPTMSMLDEGDAAEDVESGESGESESVGSGAQCGSFPFQYNSLCEIHGRLAVSRAQSKLRCI